MPRLLRQYELDELTQNPNVKKIAVENFLMSMPLDFEEGWHIENCRLDTASYKWNLQTKQAILKGIKKSYSKVFKN